MGAVAACDARGIEAWNEDDAELWPIDLGRMNLGSSAEAPAEATDVGEWLEGVAAAGLPIDPLSTGADPIEEDSACIGSELGAGRDKNPGAPGILIAEAIAELGAGPGDPKPAIMRFDSIAEIAEPLRSFTGAAVLHAPRSGWAWTP